MINNTKENFCLRAFTWMVKISFNIHSRFSSGSEAVSKGWQNDINAAKACFRLLVLLISWQQMAAESGHAVSEP